MNSSSLSPTLILVTMAEYVHEYCNILLHTGFQKFELKNPNKKLKNCFGTEVTPIWSSVHVFCSTFPFSSLEITQTL